MYGLLNSSCVGRLVLSHGLPIFDSKPLVDTSAGTSDTLGTFTYTADTPTVRSSLE